jgi:Glycosyltransferase family 20
MYVHLTPIRFQSPLLSYFKTSHTTTNFASINNNLIWIHDYHLLLISKFLRLMIPDVYLGLFVHTP